MDAFNAHFEFQKGKWTHQVEEVEVCRRCFIKSGHFCGYILSGS
jgi:hypothetical protein